MTYIRNRKPRSCPCGSPIDAKAERCRPCFDAMRKEARQPKVVRDKAHCPDGRSHHWWLPTFPTNGVLHGVCVNCAEERDYDIEPYLTPATVTSQKRGQAASMEARLAKAGLEVDA